jgi:predicted permease
MIYPDGWKRLFRLDRFGRNMERSMEEELRFHLEEQIDQYIRQGLSEDEARSAALDRFGDLEAVRDDCRTVLRHQQKQVRRGESLGDLLRDLRLAIRGLRRITAFTVVAVGTLALGIGGVVTVFSLINALMIRPLPYEAPDELVCLWSRLPDFENGGVSYPDLVDWRERNDSFVDLAGINFGRMVLTGAGGPTESGVARVSAATFQLLGASPLMGRTFLEEEDRVGGERVAVLTHRFWRERLGEAPTILGDTIVLDNLPYTVVGVMPPEFTYPPYMQEIDLYLPLGQFADQWRNQRGNHIILLVLGRLKQGIDVTQARADMDRIAIGLEQEYPQLYTGKRVHVVPLHERLTRDARSPLLLLLAAVGLVLLIACSNVACMLLARGACRRQEIVVRSALGAGRGHIVRLLLSESLILWLIGGGLGLLVAAAATSFISIKLAVFRPVFMPVVIDANVLMMALLITLLTGGIFGLFPAFRSLRVRNSSGLGNAGRSSRGRPQARLQNGFIFTETAVAVFLLFGAGLTIRSLSEIVNADLGMDTKNMLSLRVNLAPARYPEAPQRRDFFFGLLDDIERLPGVVSAATTFILPLSSSAWQNDFYVEGQPVEEPGLQTWAEVSAVSPGYFRTMDIPLLQGRDFTFEDRADSERLVIVNRTLAQRYWPDEDPVGRRLKFGKSFNDNPWMRVAGVVEDVRWRGALVAADLQLYIPHQQDNDFGYYLVVRTESDPRQVVEPIRQTVQALDSYLPIAMVRTMTDLVRESAGQNRMLALLLGAFAALALVLAGVGVYGVVSYATAERGHEIGIRMALGADTGQVVALVLQQGLGKVFAGMAAGLVSALLMARLLAHSLYGISITDPLVLACTLLFFLLTTMLALMAPVRRATAIDPVQTLKRE